MTTDSPRTVRVFVNAVGVNVAAGTSVLEAVRAWDAAEAAAVSRGELMVTDSRGLPIGTEEEVHAGSIFRLLPVRKRAPAERDDDDSGSED
jgi:hypothetical protein